MIRVLRCVAATLLLLIAAPLAAQEPAPATVIYLVRHAEKVSDGSQDPPLSEAGQRRAQTVARMFADAGITAVHTTPTERTRATAAPLAAALGVAPHEYDARDLPALARRLAGAGGRHLVVGHSNTTPELVRLLGGTADPMAETEYGRMYEVVIAPDGVRTVVLGYPPDPNAE